MQKIYLDKYYITKSSNIEKELAEAICKSACMVLVFSQLYEHKIWCLREFIAMEQIENKRKQMLGYRYDRTRRMIIPIKLGVVDNLPSKIKGIQYVDFPNFPRKSLNISRKEEEQLE